MVQTKFGGDENIGLALKSRQEKKVNSIIEFSTILANTATLYPRLFEILPVETFDGWTLLQVIVSTVVGLVRNI